MKYSFIIPYYNRSIQFYNTLTSFVHFYGSRSDIEVIVLEDLKNYKNQDYHDNLEELLLYFNDHLNISSFIYFDKISNPAPLYNLGVDKACGEFIILTSPECFHSVDVITGFDYEFLVDENAYVICSCLEVKGPEVHIKNYFDFNYIKGDRGWYHHTKVNNTKYHFCSSMSKSNYLEIGGFDPSFAYGISYEDNDFRDRVCNRLEMVYRDDLVVLHQIHERFSERHENFKELVKRNRSIYENKRRGFENEVQC